MLTEVISKLDRAVLELALVDAFADMCFYEGEEFIAELEKYLETVDNKTNTEEQDGQFFETSMPYIEHSVMKYGAGIYESIKEGGKPGKPPANDSLKKIGMVPAENKNILGKDSKAAYESELTEAEEIEIWEGLGKTIYPAVKEGIDKAKKKIKNTGKNLSNAITSGVASAKMFAKNLTGMKISKDKAAITAPQGKI